MDLMKALEIIIYFSIGVLGLIAAGCFISVVKSVNSIEEELEEKRKKKTRKKYAKGGVQTISDPDTWEETYDLMKEFSKPRITYSTAEQLIPVFPLLGILGTVLGIIVQLNAKDIDSIFDSLGTSMWTTLAGLAAAIILRLVDALFVSKKVTELEIRFDMYEQDYQMFKDNALQGDNKSEQQEAADQGK